MTEPNAALLKIKKDALISSLFTLSKAAQEASSATIDFYNQLSGTPSGFPSSLTDLSSILASSATDLSLAHTDADFAAATAAANLDVTSPSVVDASLGAPPNDSELGKKKKVKRQRAPVDPDAPKKPVTAFFMYVAGNRKIVQAELQASKPPGEVVGNHELTAELGLRWHALTEGEREAWKHQYKELMDVYNIKKQAYDEDKKAADAVINGINDLPKESPVKPKSPVKRVVAEGTSAENTTPSKSSQKRKRKDGPGNSSVTEIGSIPVPVQLTPVSAIPSTPPPSDKSKREKKKDKKRRKPDGLSETPI